MKRLSIEREDALANVVGMAPRQFFSLHYTQLCGMLVAEVGRDAAINNDEHILPTPALNLLLLLSPRFSSNIGRLLDSSKMADQVEPRTTLRSQIDEAMAVINALQAELASGVMKLAFRFAFLVWGILFSLATASVVLTYQGIITALGEIAVYLILAVPACLMLAFAAAVIGMLLFAWLDRAFSRR